MDQTDPRVAFIRARLDEALENAESIHGYWCGEIVYDGTCNCGLPEFVRADVEAKQKLLDAHLRYYLDGDDENLPIPTVTILAGIWSGHDDYAALFPQSSTS